MSTDENNLAHAQATQNEWGWWSSDNDESYGLGPYKTRQEAITEVMAHPHPVDVNAVHVIEAKMETTTISQNITLEAIDLILENAEEQICSPEDWPHVLDLLAEDRQQLHCVIVNAIAAWEAEKKLAFQTGMFGETRNKETLSLADAQATTA